MIKPIESEKNYLCSRFFTMRNSTLLIVISLFFWNCTKENSLVFSDEKYEKISELGDGEQNSKVTIAIPLAIAENIVSDSINTTIRTFIENVIYLNDTPNNFSSYEELAASFIDSYEELKKEYPDEVEWEADVKGKITFQSEKLLNIKLEYYVFAGGAHGYFGVKSFFFDPKTGKQLTPEELFSDIEGLTLLAESKFRDKFKIDKNKNINSQGFMFEDDVFYLPENIFVTDNGILLVYNTYEIASYADGIQELHIPFTEVKPFFKLDIN